MKHRRRGFSVVEVGLATIIVGGLLVASLSGVAALSTARRQGEMADKASALSNALLEEMLTQPYSTLASGAMGSGPSGAESATGNRTLYNEIGDYGAVNETIIRTRAGTTVSNCTYWGRRVSIVFLNPADKATVSAADTGMARITVSVFGPGSSTKPLARATGIRTLGWDVANKRSAAAQSGVLNVVVSPDVLGADE